MPAAPMQPSVYIRKRHRNPHAIAGTEWGRRGFGMKAIGLAKTQGTERVRGGVFCISGVEAEELPTNPRIFGCFLVRSPIQ